MIENVNSDDSNIVNDQTIHRERLEAILANAVDAIVTIDEFGIVESVNPATKKLFGYDADEVIGQNVNILMPSPYRDDHDSYIKNYLDSSQPKIIGIGREVVGKRKDGSTFPMHLAVSEIVVNGRRLFTGIIRDISDLKLAEQQLAQANQDLQERIKERVRHLEAIESAQRKLVQNERLAAIGQMMAGLAHESRNAFQKSHACLSNLAFDVREMPESLELVGKVQNALDLLNALLEEVRDYAAPIVLELSPTNIPALINEIWNQLIDANPESGQIRFEMNVDGDVPEKVRVDRLRLGQVIWNLLENARAASDSEKGQISVSISMLPCDSNSESESESKICIQVADNGSGVSPEVAERIFEPFFTTKTKGTGLGLAICQRIINAHGGEIKLGRADEGGACFQVLVKA